MDIMLITTNARYKRVSNRRQKKMLTKMPHRLFKNVWPKSVGELKDSDDGSSMVSFDVTFTYEELHAS